MVDDYLDDLAHDQVEDSTIDDDDEDMKESQCDCPSPNLCAAYLTGRCTGERNSTPTAERTDNPRELSGILTFSNTKWNNFDE